MVQAQLIIIQQVQRIFVKHMVCSFYVVVDKGGDLTSLSATES